MFSIQIRFLKVSLVEVRDVEQQLTVNYVSVKLGGTYFRCYTSKKKDIILITL